MIHPVQQHRLQIDRYLSPTTMVEALEMIADHALTGRLIAGGTDLLLELTRGQRPGVTTLIDLSRTEGLNTISTDGNDLLIGATTTHRDVVMSPLIRERALPLAQASLEVASPQIRNRATVVGNVVTASPANDTITPLRALGTTVEIASIEGRRRVDLGDFHSGVRRVDLSPTEMVTGLRVTGMRPTQRAVFVKLGLRRAQAISVIHLALVLDFDGDRVIEAAVALGSVAPTIIQAPVAERFLVGRTLDRATIGEAARMVAELPSPIDDIRATADYRRRELEVLTERALSVLANREHDRRWPLRHVTLGTPTAATSPSLDIDPDAPIAAVINGVQVEAPAASTMTLLDWLRDHAGPGLTGTKEGCAEGECGACTVYLDGVAVMSCLVPAGRAARAEITTIEGLANGPNLHPLQQAFLEQGAVQCGFCIPGFLMAGAKLLDDYPDPTTAEIKTAMSGNLCRCTGYYRIISAVESTARGPS
ncbi:MAG: FAD binding domain-containing protein [Actinomycetota bacterium]